MKIEDIYNHLEFLRPEEWVSENKKDLVSDFKENIFCRSAFLSDLIMRDDCLDSVQGRRYIRAQLEAMKIGLNLIEKAEENE